MFSFVRVIELISDSRKQMEPLILTMLASSNSGHPVYAVDCRFIDGVLTMRCTCGGCETESFCKHVKGFLNGSSELIAHEDDAEIAREFERVARFHSGITRYKEDEFPEYIE